MSNRLKFSFYAMVLLAFIAPVTLIAQDESTESTEPAPTAAEEISRLEELISPAKHADSLIETRLQTLGEETLEDFTEVYQRLAGQLESVERALRLSVSEPEQERLKARIGELERQIDRTQLRFEEIATGVKLGSADTPDVEQLTLAQNVQVLLDPLFKSLRQTTEGMREKADLVEEISQYESDLEKTETALTNLNNWIESDVSDASRQKLKALSEKWENNKQEISSNLKASQLELNTLESEKPSMRKRFSSNLKRFVQTRGLYLFLALSSFFLILALAALIFRFLKLSPWFQEGKRSFNIRLFVLAYKVIAVVIASQAPLAVFYAFEDWVLFSLTLLVFIGLAWSLRSVLPNFWRQGRLLLNIGAVREGERIEFRGLPWRVRALNLFSELENPVTKLRLRLPIEELIGLTSKPVQTVESWFPCKKGDWVILSDGYRGHVSAISVEFVDVDDRGSSTRTYPMQDFLALNPLNISESFRLKETLGISYDHQQVSTNRVLGALKRFIQSKVVDEGYEPHITNLLVEFERMNESSLDIAVIVDVDGSQAPFYNRIRRAIQRWCVDACNEYGWEIPFPQRSLHLVESGLKIHPSQTDLFDDEARKSQREEQRPRDE